MSEWLLWWLMTGAALVMMGLFLWPAIYTRSD